MSPSGHQLSQEPSLFTLTALEAGGDAFLLEAGHGP